MDPLSDILALLQPTIHGASGFDMGGEWSIHFPAYRGIKCYAMVSGQCWLAMTGIADAVRLEPGDCVLLPRGRSFRMASDLALHSIETSGCDPRGAIETFQGGGGCFLVGGHFALSDAHADILLRTLPPIVHVRDEVGSATLRWLLDTMREEVSRQQPGVGLMSEHLAHMILIRALRIHIAQGPLRAPGWLYALTDRSISAAINAVHLDPAHPWTVPVLAKRAGMSRSGFALRFREIVGETPMRYVTRWRMLTACERLSTFGEPIAVVARSLSYASESAFGIAFKRATGSSPRQFCRDWASKAEARHRTQRPLPPEKALY